MHHKWRNNEFGPRWGTVLRNVLLTLWRRRGVIVFEKHSQLVQSSFPWCLHTPSRTIRQDRRFIKTSRHYTANQLLSLCTAFTQKTGSDGCQHAKQSPLRRPEWGSEQFLNGTSAHVKLFSALPQCDRFAFDNQNLHYYYQRCGAEADSLAISANPHGNSRKNGDLNVKVDPWGGGPYIETYL